MIYSFSIQEGSCPNEKSFCALLKKSFQILVSGKFFFMALGFLVLYTVYVNMGYIRFMQMPPYKCVSI